MRGGPGNTIRWSFQSLSSRLHPGGDSASDATQRIRCLTRRGDVYTIFGDLAPTWAAVGGVARMEPFEGSDQLVGPPTNQGQIGSSISTARHVPRPPNTDAMQHVKISDRHPSSRSLQLRLRPRRARAVNAEQSWISGRHLEQVPSLRRIASNLTRECVHPAIKHVVGLHGQFLGWSTILPPDATSQGSQLDWSDRPLSGVNTIDLGCMITSPTPRQHQTPAHTGTSHSASCTKLKPASSPLGSCAPWPRPSPYWSRTPSTPICVPSVPRPALPARQDPHPNHTRIRRLLTVTEIHPLAEQLAA
jgi:hypothetical protein